MSTSEPPAEPTADERTVDEPTADEPTDRRPTAEEPAELSAAERRRRRAALLADIAEARELRARVAPRRTRLARTRAALRRRVFRFDPPPHR